MVSVFWNYFARAVLCTVFAFACLLFPSRELLAATAYLSLAPSSGTFYVGNTFTVSILLDTGGETVEAVDVGLAFPPDKLQVVSPNTGKSFIDAWTTPPFYSNTEGVIRFAGLAPAEFAGSAALISTAVFRVTGIGEAAVSFSSDSILTRAGGDRANILSQKTLGGGRYELAIPPPEGPRVVSPTHPNPAVWYRDVNPVLVWERDAGDQSYGFSLDQNPLGASAVSKQTGEDTLTTFSNVADGIWYFHLRAKKENGFFGRETIFPIRVDATPPADFTPRVTAVGSSQDLRYLLEFSASDAVSNIDHYEVQIVNVNDPKSITVLFTEATSPYSLPQLQTGEYRFTVRAYDRAGNVADGVAMLDLLSSPVFRRGFHIGALFVPWFLLFILGVLVAAVAWFVFHEFFKHHRSIHSKISRDIETAHRVIEKDIRELETRHGEEEHADALRGEVKKLEKLKEEFGDSAPPPPPEP